MELFSEERSAQVASTESTVLGPFHMVESPPRELGDDIALDGKGEPCLVTGRVTGPDGEPLAGALVDVWQANADGSYDVQQPDVQPERNLRGLFTTDHDGRFRFRTIVPRYYPIPDDGPVGQLLAATNRHPYRPAHVHFIATAPGYRPVTTHLFVDDTINAKGAYFTVQKLAPLLGEGAGVVLTTSAANVLGIPMISAYAATKAAVRSMTWPSTPPTPPAPNCPSGTCAVSWLVWTPTASSTRC
jgi:protocatechuate 3,4-dioxygenase beta subunit